MTDDRAEERANELYLDWLELAPEGRQEFERDVIGAESEPVRAAVAQLRRSGADVEKEGWLGDDPLVGHQVGPYKIVELRSSSKLAKVYLAHRIEQFSAQVVIILRTAQSEMFNRYAIGVRAHADGVGVKQSNVSFQAVRGIRFPNRPMPRPSLASRSRSRHSRD